MLGLLVFSICIINVFNCKGEDNLWMGFIQWFRIYYCLCDRIA